MRTVAATTIGRVSVEPHVALAAGAVVVLAAEAAHRTFDSVAWLLVEALAAGGALLIAWRRQEELRLGPLLALAASLHGAWIALHLGLDVVADKDASVVYRWQGNALLNGDYPRSEYPVGAVLLFGLEAWLGGGTTRVPNALLMIPFQLLCVGAIWSCRTRLAPWLASFVALWPLNAYSWEFKYDLAPAALLAVGIALAVRERWVLSGAVLGAGALVKWTPGLAAVALVAFLLASRRFREALAHGASLIFVVAGVYAPLLVWDRDVLAAYSRQAGRAITPESLWYLLLRPFDLARVRTHISFAAGAPEWADVAAGVAQAALIVAVVALAVRARHRPQSAIALAALAPGVFLLTNRIFSPQFLVVVFVGWALAGALVARTSRQQLGVAVLAGAASVGNAFVYPFALPFYAYSWVAASAILFVAAVATTAWLALSAAAEPRTARTGP